MIEDSPSAFKMGGAYIYIDAASPQRVNGTEVSGLATKYRTSLLDHPSIVAYPIDQIDPYAMVADITPRIKERQPIEPEDSEGVSVLTPEDFLRGSRRR